MEITKAKIWTITYVTHDAIACEIYTETRIATSEETAKEIREEYIWDIESGLSERDTELFKTYCPTSPDILNNIKYIETYGNGNVYQIIVEEHPIEIM